MNPVTLTFDPMGVNSLVNPKTYTRSGWDKFMGLGDIIDFQYDLDLYPLGSLLGPNLIHIPSLVGIRTNWVLDTFKIFQFNLEPCDLAL